MQKILYVLIITLFFNSNVSAFCFLNCKTPGLYFSLFSEDDDKISKSDPSSAGCVYNEFGKKVKCASYKFNENKKPGSYAEARNDCINYLRKYKKQNYTLEGCS
jgi:hypothetical protein